MNVAEYFQKTQNTLRKFSFSIITLDIQEDIRSDNIGVLHAGITFHDGSQLHAMEYVETVPKLRRLSYSYHYQSKRGALIFRFDNAAHRPAPPAVNHLHLPGKKVVAAKKTDLQMAMSEVMDILKKQQ